MGLIKLWKSSSKAPEELENPDEATNDVDAMDDYL
jgi:hypothetical protein